MSSAAMGRTRCPVCCPLSLFRPSVVDEVAPDVDRHVHRRRRRVRRPAPVYGTEGHTRSRMVAGLARLWGIDGAAAMSRRSRGPQRLGRVSRIRDRGRARRASFSRRRVPALGVVAPPDREVKRGGIRRPGEVRRIEQARGTVDARRGSRGGRDGGHECADDRGACAGSAGAEEDWRPCGIQPELQPPEPERGSPLGVGRSCDSMRGVRHLCVEHASRPGRRPTAAASNWVCGGPGTTWRPSGALRFPRRRPPRRPPPRI